METGAKVTGLLVFVGGVVLLIVVFMSALGMLNHAQAVQIRDIAKDLPREAIQLLMRVGFLFILGYISSSIAARGIQLYEAALAREREKDTVTAP